MPVIGQVFEGYAVVLCRVIDIAADRADVLTRSFLLGEIHFGQNGRHGMIEIHHALGLQVLIALWGVSAAINGGVVADELAHTVERLTGGGKVIKNDRLFVLVEGFVHVGDVAVKHVEQTVHLYHDDAVALSMALGLDKVDAVGNLLAFGEVVVGTVGIADWNNVCQSLQLNGIYLFLVHIDFRVGETFQFAAVVSMSVGE